MHDYVVVKHTRQQFLFMFSRLPPLKGCIKQLDSMVLDIYWSFYVSSKPLLKKAKEKTLQGLQRHSKLWESNGCSLMTDSWTNKHRCVKNMCVHSDDGVSFDSIEDSTSSHIRNSIFK